MARAKTVPHSEDRVVISLPKTELETLTRLVEDLRFIEKTEKIKEERSDEDYIALSELKEKSHS
ncbi:MAG: hypothetical protein SVV03_06630 [Candidatus Nanohaloarchaea archaeon]|nr:hypothetical protein [Candidatus Nanohaloarchaea archaeon]